MGMPTEPVYALASYRFRTNVKDPSGVNAAFDAGDTAADTVPTLEVNTLYRARFVIQQTESAANVTANLATEVLCQYNHEGNGWNDFGTEGGGTAVVEFDTPTGFTDGDNTTQVLGGGSFVTGDGMAAVGRSDTITFTTEAVSETEVEVSFRVNVTAAVNKNDTVEVRFLYSVDDANPPATIVPISVSPAPAFIVNAPYRLTADPGSVAITGTDATLSVTVPGAPAVAGTPATTMWSSDTATPSITMPTGIVAGNGLLAIVGVDEFSGAPTTIDETSSPNDYVKLGQIYNEPDNILAAVFWKAVAAGDASDNLDVTIDQPERGSAIVVRITGHDPSVTPGFASATSSGSSDSPNPPSLTDSPADKILWVALASNKGAETYTGFPSGYGNTVSVQGDASGAGCAMAFKAKNGSVEDPGVFTLSAASQGWAAFTVSFPPGTTQTVLTATPGSVAITGTDANLEHHHVLTATPGSFTVTGTDAALAKVFTLTATPGSFTVTGTNANLEHHRVLTADPGSVAVTGTDANLEDHRVLVADPGTVTITGTDAALSTAIRLAADPGNFTITGTDANLEHHHVLTASPGSVAVTGTDANLEHHHVLAATPGAVVITGTDATLSVAGQTVLSADPGSFTITGTNANLEHHHVLTATPGAVTITGTAATIGRALTLTATPGSFTVTGTDANLEHHHVLTATAGSVAITGTDATLTKVGVTVLTAESGSFTITGTAAGLLYGRVFAVDPGSVVITGTDASLVYGGVFTLTAEPGSVVITGTDAALYRVITLTAEAGGVAVTGTPASLTAHRTLTADPGAVAITGTAAGTTVHRLLTADPGTVAITGTDAAVRAHRVLTAAAGAVVITGTDANLDYSAQTRLVAEPGAFVITGTDATLAHLGLRTAADMEFTVAARDMDFVVAARDADFVVAARAASFTAA